MVQSTTYAGLVATAVSLFSTVNGHMTLAQPAPYGGDALTSSPISAANMFPCNLDGSSDWAEPAEANVMAIGEDQPLSFKGSATHGGGSCQIALTTDKKPTASSKWQVIHSIEGGCPSAAPGNGQDGTNSADQFSFKIPDGIDTGDYTLAWTWFNKIGNREFYMNCAPVTVTGAKKRRYAPSTPVTKRQSSFPDMAVANLEFVNGCTTEEGTDIQFADPGASLEKSPDAKLAGFVQKQGGSACPFLEGGSGGSSNSGGSSGSDSGSSGSGGDGSSGSGNSAPAPSPTSSAQVTQSTPGVFVPSSSAAPEPTPSVEPVSSAPPAASPTGAASSDSGSNNGSSSGSSSGSGSGSSNGSGASNGSTTAGASCSTEGATECAADGKSYQICASGYWQTLPVAEGMQCEGAGVQANVNVVASHSKRHAHAHLRRRNTLRA